MTVHRESLDLALFQGLERLCRTCDDKKSKIILQHDISYPERNVLFSRCVLPDSGFFQNTNRKRKGKERKGKERKGKERKGKERKGKERKGKERKGKERKAAVEQLGKKN